MITKKTKQEVSYEEIKQELAEIKHMLAERKHIDEDFKILKTEHHDLMNGNGKPGFKSVRDKVLSWETKINAIILLIIGDVVLRVFFAVVK